MGRIAHKEKVYLGLHLAITSPELFERTQAMLASNLQGSRPLVCGSSPSLLAGKLVDAASEPLIASHATKGKARYRHNVSRSLHEARSTNGLRISAREIEGLAA